MFVVLFEVQPHPDRWSEYFDIAGLLRPELVEIDGFIDNTRFASARTEGRLLSLSTWRDEKSLIRWRSHATHHEEGQVRGRFEVFADYRLRVAEVTGDSHLPAGLEIRESRLDETEVGRAKAVTILEDAGAGVLPEFVMAEGLVDAERYDGVVEPHSPLVLAGWTTADAALAGTPVISGVRVRHARVIREYGRHDRHEAPQYFPPVRRTSGQLERR